MEKSTILYFSRPGPENTPVALERAVERARELEIEHIVVASSSGETGLLLLEKAREARYAGKIVVVTYHAGFGGGDDLSLSLTREAELRSQGAVVVRSLHALSGVSRSFRERFGGVSIPEVIAESFRRISEGFKVAVEVSLMAADAGVIPTSSDVVALGGKGRGVDTALVLRPAHQNSFFQLKIREILCFPKS
ncbi:MAG: pyruvate kinase alpha/beta domain-containing protein [Candidatus Caldatribacteriaceae bacterium]